MDINVIIANIICAISYIILIVCTYLNIKKKWILVSFVVVCLLYGLQCLILKAYSGAFSQFFSSIMFIVYNFKGRNKFLDSVIIPIIFFIGYIIIGILSWKNIYDILPLLASLISCISMWFGKEVHIKTSNIPISVMWIVYSFIYMSYAGAIGQTIVLITDFVYLYLYFKKYRYQNEERNLN